MFGGQLPQTQVLALVVCPLHMKPPSKTCKLQYEQGVLGNHMGSTNATLSRYSLMSSEQCHFCTDTQTLKQLFVTCSRVLSFWAHFTNWWNGKNQGVITLLDTDIIYGFTNDLPLRLGLNLCIILAKYYIYTASKRDEEYIWQAFTSKWKNINLNSK